MPRYDESAKDPYVNEETGILKNLLGCRTEDELSLKERELSYLRQNMMTDLIRRNLVPRIELLQSKVNSRELTPAAAVAEVERTRYLSVSDRIKLRSAFENNTAVEFLRRPPRRDTADRAASPCDNSAHETKAHGVAPSAGKQVSGHTSHTFR
jgi:hypothetical protein